MMLLDPELEQKALGAIILGGRGHLAAQIPEEALQNRYRPVLRTMRALHDRGVSIDVESLYFELRRAGVSNSEVSGADLLDLTNSVATSVNCEFFVQQLRSQHVRHLLCGIRPERIVHETETPEEAGARIKAVVDVILATGASPARLTGLDLLRSVDEQLNAVASPSGTTGLSTGLRGLDALLDGLQPGNLYVVAARTGEGKSALAMQIALRTSFEVGRVLVFSMEMSKKQLARRAGPLASGIPWNDVRRPGADPLNVELFLKRCRALEHAKIMIDTRSALSIDEVTGVTHIEHGRSPLSLCVIDYLQLAHASERRQDSREQEVAEVVRKTKALAKAIDAPVIALSQLNRDVERRANRKPTLADLRESGSIEQDADVVLALYHPHRTDPEKFPDPTSAEIHVLKNRDGEQGIVPVRWISELVRFDDGVE